MGTILGIKPNPEDWEGWGGEPMKNGIPADNYYKLLEWKDSNLKKFRRWYDNKSLNDLTTEQLKELWNRIPYSQLK